MRGQGAPAPPRKRRRKTRRGFWLLVALVPTFVGLALVLTLLLEADEQVEAHTSHDAQLRAQPAAMAVAMAAPALYAEELDQATALPSHTLQQLSASEAPLPPTLPSAPPAAPPAASLAAGHLAKTVQDASQCWQDPTAANQRVDVTLVTQGSSDRLWMVPHICARWGGAMIVATLRSEDGARPPWPEARSTTGVNGTSGMVSTAGCSLLRMELTAPTPPTSAGRVGGADTGYPINWLRNSAIGCVATTHYFIADIDFWPSAELLPLLRKQLGGWGASAPPRVLVVPSFQRSGHGCRNADDPSACRTAFESRVISMPAYFDELQRCVGAHDCVVFDGEYNPHGQASTDVRAWRQLRDGQTRRVTCITSERYEPFVTLRKGPATPSFDERFTGYGKNKVQLLVHLRLAGFSFEVLGRGFLLHFPHQPSTAKHHWLHSGAHGRVDRLFAAFTQETATRYVGTPPGTPLCSARGGGARRSGHRAGGAREGSSSSSSGGSSSTSGGGRVGGGGGGVGVGGGSGSDELAVGEARGGSDG